MSDRTEGRPSTKRELGRESRLPDIGDPAIQRAISSRIRGESAKSPTRAPGEGSNPAEADGGVATDSGSDGPGPNLSTGGSDPGGTTAGSSDREGLRPYIKITPAREQVTPDHVIKALYGLYRAANGRELPFHLERRLPFVSPKYTFEFLIHKPAATQRFDFYLGVRPYEVEVLGHLAANVRSMYPDSFWFEIVPFAPAEIFVDDAEPSNASLLDLESFEGIDELVKMDGIDSSTLKAGSEESRRDVDFEEGSDPTPPAMVRWEGDETKNNDKMTLLSLFSEISIDADDSFRSPLSVPLEQAVDTDDPFVFQAVFRPRPDWTDEAEAHKRNLKTGTTGLFTAFKQEFFSLLLGTSEEERRQRHRPDTPEQIGGTVSGGGDGSSTRQSRMGQIDLKQPAITFDLSLRAAGESAVLRGVTGAFTDLSGPYYGIVGTSVTEIGREFEDFCNASLGRIGIRGRFEDSSPIIVASPDELANFVTVPSTGSLPKASRGASGGSPNARSPLTATDEELLSEFDTGMCVGEAVTANPDRPNIPIHLTAEQLTHHVLRASTTGGGKTTGMINGGLSAYEELDGPIFIVDKKGGSLASEYKRAHFRRFSDLDDVVHLPIPGPNGEVPAFPFFEIRPQLAAGMSREAAVQEKIDRVNELLTYVLGAEQHDSAFVAQEILNHLIMALFDPVYGQDAFGISDLLDAATAMQTEGTIPDVSDPERAAALARHLHADPQRFANSIDAVLNRITKLQERDFIWRLLNFVPEWDAESGAYAEDQMLLDLDELLDSKKVILVDTGDLRPASRNMFSVLLLDYLWSWVRHRKRWGRPVPEVGDGYCVNLIIDEAAPIVQASLVRDEMIPDAREFSLAFEFIVHFSEQVKRDALDVRAYKELIRNANIKLLGKHSMDEELAKTLFHEELDTADLMERIASLPRGEWLAQLLDTGFLTDTPELFTMKSLPIPRGHSDGSEPVEAGTFSPTAGMTFQEADELQWSRTRFTYCLIPGVNSPPNAAQRASRYGTGPMNSGRTEESRSGDSGSSTETGSESDTGSSASPSSPEPSNSREEDSHSPPETDDPWEDFEEVTDEGREDGSLDVNQDRPDGGASNEFGSSLGTGTPDRDSHSDSPGRVRDEDGDTENRDSEHDSTAGVEGVIGSKTDTGSGTGEELTENEYRFLRDVVAAINGELEGYDLTESMTKIRDAIDGEIDEDRLEAGGFLEIQSVYNRKYYYVTPKGQSAIDRKIYRGRNTGDPFEKTAHKVYVEYVARHLRNQGLIVETYYEPMAGGMVFDVAAFVPNDDGGRTLAVIAEVVTNIRSDLVVKHYDDLATFDRVRKMIVVPHTDAAHDIIRTLVERGRLDHAPQRNIRNYTTLSEEAFDAPREWRFVGGRNIIRAVDRTEESQQ